MSEYIQDMKKLLVLCLFAVLLFAPRSVNSQELFYEPGVFSISVAGSVLPLVSFETGYALLPQLMVEGELGLHIGTGFGGSIVAHAGLALPSLTASELYRYKGFEYYGAGIGVFMRHYPFTSGYFKYSLQACANFSWHPETLIMYFFVSFIPEITFAPKVSNWKFGSIQGSLALPVHMHLSYYSFGLGLSFRFLITPFSQVRQI